MGRDEEAYCKLHETYGHSTEKCRDLMNQIEVLIREGKLERFQAWKNNKNNYPRKGKGYGDQRYDDRHRYDSGRHNEQRYEQRYDYRRREEGREGRPQNEGRKNGRRTSPMDNEPAHPAINSISGGETMAGSTSSSRKAYAREAFQVNTVVKEDKDEFPITFTSSDQGDIKTPHDDPMVVSAVVAKYPVERILVDSGSSINLIYWNCFQKMNLTPDRLKAVSTPLYSFTGEAVPVVGSIQLATTLGTEPHMVTRITTYMVVKSTSSAYNIIIGRPLLNDMRAVVSSAYLLMKFPTPQGVGEVRGNQKKARACYVTSLKETNKRQNEAMPIDKELHIYKSKPFKKQNCGGLESLSIGKQPDTPKPKPVEDLEAVKLDETNEEKLVYVGSQLCRNVKNEIIQCLRNNADIFAWSPADMPGVDPQVISHHLNVDPKMLPIKQKKRNIFGERDKRPHKKKWINSLMLGSYAKCSIQTGWQT